MAGNVEEEVNSLQPPSAQAKAGAEREMESGGARMSARVEAEDRMTDEEREKRYARFSGEGTKLRAILELPGAELFWGRRTMGSRLEDISRQIMDSRRKDKDQPPPLRREPEGEKTTEREEEQGSWQPPRRPEQVPPPSEQGSWQLPPPPSEQAKVVWFPSSWVTFPRKEDNPATWITDEYGEWRSRGGLLLGFSDPVSTIIFNAIYLMEKSCRQAPTRTGPRTQTSRAAQVLFMTFYFRHLTEAQAKLYLRAARHDLSAAICLVESHRKGGNFDLPVVGDCGRTKTAIRYAAEAAMLLRDPEDLVRLWASRFPCHLLHPALEGLRQAERFSVGHVNDILNLLRHPWSPPPPLPAPTPGTFRDKDGNITIIVNIGQDLFSTTTVTTDRVAAFNNGSNGDLVTTTSISRHQSCQGDDNGLDTEAAAYLSSGSDTESRLRSFLSATTAQQLQPDTKSLKMCLLDTIHGLYIQALAMLPSDHQPRLLGAVLAGGHCYGVMEDPVSNILVNSIWYNARFPHLHDDDDTPSMTRAESSSLHGLIAILCADRGVAEQEAVTFLCSNRRSFSDHVMTKSFNRHSLAAAAEAAKHPQPAALLAFFTTLLTSEKRDRLRSLLMAKRALSDADFKELNTMIAPAVQRMATTPDLGQSALNTVPATVQTMTTPDDLFHTAVPAEPLKRMTHDRWLQSYVRTKVKELLLDYGRNNPLGPQYKLGVICGMESTICSSFHRYTKCKL